MADDASPTPPQTVDIQTQGCRLNTYESEVMRRRTAEAGLTDAVIIHTCAVTAEAVRQSRQAVRRARRDRPEAAIFVTGCAVQTDPQTFADMPEVTRIIGNTEKLTAAAFAANAPRVAVGDIMAETRLRPVSIDGLEGRTRAIVQVQTGCDHRCTFCIIPFGRGNSRSAPPEDILEQIRRLASAGHHEVVLTGVDLTSWGADLPGAPCLGDLVGRILRDIPDLPQLRLSSLDAIEIDSALFDLVTGEPRVAPYLHLSLQSGDDLILKRMKRRHSRADAIHLCQRLRAARPEIAFGADFIAGFPTETEEMFNNTLDLIEACGIDYCHIFPYSPRPGTPASRMPQLAHDVIRDRAARLRDAGARRLIARLDRHVGATATALVESGGRARLPDFAPVRLEGPLPPAARPVIVKITGRTDTHLVGHAA